MWLPGQNTDSSAAKPSLFQDAPSDAYASQSSVTVLSFSSCTLARPAIHLLIHPTDVY